MFVNHGKIVGLKTVLDDLNPGHDYMSENVYRCRQYYYYQPDETNLFCPAEFTTEFHNLKTSKIDPEVNVDYDKCLNVKICERFCVTRERKSRSDYVNGDAVKCKFCDTVIGCIYNDTIALVNVIVDKCNC